MCSSSLYLVDIKTLHVLSQIAAVLQNEGKTHKHLSTLGFVSLAKLIQSEKCIALISLGT